VPDIGAHSRAMNDIFFLPGTGASPEFWKPVGERLPPQWSKHYFGWPGLSAQPPDPAINSYDDLVRLVEARLDGPVDLVAQSMGGLIAVRVALAHPSLVRRLVLTATSGGIDVSAFGASDWRADYRKAYPDAPAWITERHTETNLPVENIRCPTLLIWGDADPISPLAVGRHLAARLPDAKLHVIASNDHRFASTRADEVAPLIAAHLDGK
jgi:pimeloyl-ACP methyl ester carboxylesterase